MKRCKQGDDLISELPDFVLEYIVSLLNIKDAIKTSVLSRRWRSIFKRRMELDINPAAVGIRFEGFLKHEKELVRRVDQLIKQFISIISLKVYLSITKQHSSHIDEWIDFAAECGVRKLELGFSYQYSFPYWLFSKPRTSRLEYLHLKWCLVNPPSDFRGFRHLKTLILEGTHLDKDFVTNLCLTCPQLEHLTLRQCIVDSNCLKITGPVSLRHVSVLHCQRPLMFEVCLMDLITFEFIENKKNQQLSLGEFPKLKKLFACQCSRRVLSIFSMFQKFPDVQILGLCLSEKQVMKFPESFAILRNLKQLNLFISSKSCKMELYRVLSLAKASPLLQKLAVTIYESEWVHEDERSNIGGQHTTVGSHHQLKEFELQGCVGLWYEIEFVVHVLRMATNLEKMVIGPSKRTYVDNGDWFGLFDDPSSYQSHKKWIENMLQDYVPPNLQFVML